MASSNRLIVAILIVAALATGFWILVLGPKRKEASALGTEVEQAQASLVQTQGQVAEAEAARREFPSDYRQLVVLGKAVPSGEETSSLLVELNQVAERSHVRFQGIQLASEGSESEAGAATTAPEVSATSPAPPTLPASEAAASLLPLGATIGSAGLATMPYDLTFTGSFFNVADFIHGIDSLVGTDKSGATVSGRLVTLDGFVLTEDSERGFPDLDADFAVTTYLVPPGQTVTAGATSEAPAEVPASTTGAPASFSTPAQ